MSELFQMSGMSRRQVLRAGVGTLLSAGLWPGVLGAAGGAESGAFRFIVANDLHYFDAKCGPYFERVARQMKRTPGVEFVLLAGDISDWGQGFQFAAVRDIFRGAGLDAHVVCGNHDWVGWDDRSTYLDIFPTATNYTFEHRGWQVMGIDSTNRNLTRRVSVTAETLHWLDETLPKIDKKRPLIAFTHFPMHPGLQWPCANAAEVLDRFRNHNLQAVYGGHCHAFREQRFGNAVVQVNRCCSRKVGNHDRTMGEKGYFLCTARDGRIEREFVEVLG